MKRSTLLSSLFAIFLGTAVAATVVTWLANRIQLRSPRLLLTGDPESMALIVYHPGLSDFPERVIDGFTRGLQESGWSVVIWTASAQTPTDLSNFDLLVLCSPINYWTPARPIKQYLERVGHLGGIHVVAVLTGMGSGKRAATIIERLVRDASGRLDTALTLYTHNPNDWNNYKGPRQNQDLAVELAKRAGRGIPPPLKLRRRVFSSRRGLRTRH